LRFSLVLNKTHVSALLDYKQVSWQSRICGCSRWIECSRSNCYWQTVALVFSVELGGDVGDWGDEVDGASSDEHWGFAWKYASGSL